MPKKIVLADYDINIEQVSSKLQKIQKQIQNSEVQGFVPQTLLKDFEELQKKVEKLRKTTPISGSSAKELQKFSQNFERLEKDIDIITNKLGKVKFSDISIRKNISEVKELTRQLREATKAKEDYQNKIANPQTGVKNFKDSGPYRKELTDLRKQFVSAAQRGEGQEGTERIKTKAASMRDKINRRISQVSSWETGGQEVLALRERLKELNSIEKSALEYARRQQTIINNEERIGNELKKQVNIYQTQLNTEIAQQRQTLQDTGAEVVNISNAYRQSAREEEKVEERQAQVANLSARIKQVFSLTTAYYVLRRAVRNAIRDFQELDKQFNEIAIVSNYSTKEMWESFSTVNKAAQEFGVTTKNVLEVQNLYYHQGKSMAEVNKLTAQTLTLAKITGMDYADATNKLTAALNAYKISATDANKVTDTVAALSASAATDSEELMTALTKTASIAASAGMSLESTEVFLTKMIETTREAPENLGTALKTIIARFGEVKQEIDGEEIELADINKVDTALKTIGISLLDTAGQVRDLDQVFMELSSKWDGLDRNTQRYIATIAAGSRQQSRFIAMMENYDRTLELSEVAQNSAGTGARQLAKSMESIETSVNRLKSSWQEFYSGFVSSDVIKFALDFANSILGVLNKLNQISPVLSAVVVGIVGYKAKTLILDGILKKLEKTFVSGVLSLKSNQAATAENATSQTFLSTIMTKLGVSTSAATQQLNVNTAAKLANASATKAQIAAEMQKQGLVKGNRLTERGKDALRRKREQRVLESSPEHQEKQAFYENFFNSPYNEGKLKGKELRLKIKETGKSSGIKGVALKGVQAAKGSITKVLTPILSIIGKIVGLLGGPLTIALGVITALLIGGLAAWKKWGKASTDDTKQVQKLQKAQESYNNTLKEYNSLKEKAKIIEKYANRQNLTAEQLQEQQDAAKELVQTYPELLDYIDEEGNYYLKDADAIQKVIDKKAELLEQEGTNYTKLRLTYAEQGIYADQETEAGKSMKTIQDYAASLDKDAIKKIGKKIDKNVTFDNSTYEAIMKAYGEGKKFSFDEKDMSNLFAGSIGQKNWNKFLTFIKERKGTNEDVFASTENLKNALYETGAYSSNTAEDVAKSFMRMNEQNAQLFSQLLEGAAEEYSNIDIQEATIQIKKGQFASELSSDLQNAIATFSVQRAKESYTDEEWNDLNEEDRQQKIQDATEKIVRDFENLTKQEIENINKVFSSSQVGALGIAEVREIDFENATVDEQRDILKTYLEALPQEIQNQFNEDDIAELTDEVVNTLFTLINSALEGQNLDTIINSLKNDYQNSLEKYEEGNPFANKDIIDSLLNGATIDQLKALKSRMSTLSVEQIAPYVNTIGKLWQEKNAKYTKEQQEILRNQLLKIDFLNTESVISNIDKLLELGFTAQEVAQMMIDASNDVKNITGLNYDTIKKNTEASLKTFQDGIKGLGALLEGTADFGQLDSFLTSMKGFYENQVAQGLLTGDDAVAAYDKLSKTVQATGKGFKLSTKQAGEYGESLYKVAIAGIDTQISLLKTKLATEELTAAEQIETQSSINLLELQGKYYNALYKQSQNDALVDNLSKAKEKADNLLDSLKALVDWLRGYDRYANLDRVIKTLQEDYGHLDFEIDFSTNIDIIEADISKQAKNINTQIFANQGGIQAAKEEQKMWADVIKKRNSAYVSFDAEGNAIVNAKELQKLQVQISKTSKERQSILKAEYDEIIDNVEAYNKAKDKVEDYSSALENNFKELKEFLQSNYDAITKIENKLIEVREAAEDRELELIRKKYEAIKEENDKYLDDIKDTIDKEREIRDRADREQDVKDKEKKLAMMQMDTSGVYAKDIKALEKELKQDYQSLEDDAVDKAISQLEEQYSATADALDKEVTYLENSLQYRRDIMTEYNEWSQQMIMSGSDTVIAYLKENDQAYYTATAAAQQSWELEWESSVARGIAANNQMEVSLQVINNNLNACKDNAGGFNEAVLEYSETALEYNGQVEIGVSELVTQYSNLAQGVRDVTIPMENLAKAYGDAANAAIALKKAQDYLAIGEYTSPPGGKNDPSIVKTPKGSQKPAFTEVTRKNLFGKQTGDKVNVTAYARDGNGNIIKDEETLENAIVKDSNGEKYVHVSSAPGNMTNAYVRRKDLVKNGLGEYVAVLGSQYYKKVYAKGGYVDYTGPAWVDGTKSHPEYMLNATQTAQFEALVSALKNLYGNNISSLKKQAVQKFGDAVYNFHITVEKMADDYDVDQLVSRLEQKMVDSSKYRNVTLLKKTQ